MRISCPFCGSRGHEEFVYLGDATQRRPTTSPDGVRDDRAQEVFADYVYLRDNPSGPHRELWHHAGGCHAWLVVERNTRTHEVLAVTPAREVTLAREAASIGAQIR